MKSFPVLLKATSLSLLLTCTIAPNLVYAMEEHEDKESTSSLLVRKSWGYAPDESLLLDSEPQVGVSDKVVPLEEFLVKIRSGIPNNKTQIPAYVTYKKNRSKELETCLSHLADTANTEDFLKKVNSFKKECEEEMASNTQSEMAKGVLKNLITISQRFIREAENRIIATFDNTNRQRIEQKIKKKLVW